MTHRKIREARVKAINEDTVFGYLAPSAGRRMMANDDEPEGDEDDLLIDGEPTHEARTTRITVGALRKAIREALKGSDRFV